MQALAKFLRTRRKFVVAVIAAVLAGINSFTGLSLDVAAPEVVTFILMVLGAFGIERVGNDPE